MPDLFSIIASDNFRLARSKSVIEPEAGTWNLIRIPQFAFVTDVWCVVTVAGSSDTVDIGFIGNGESADPDHFLDAAYLLVNATGIGVYKASQDTTSNFPGKWFNSADGVLTMTIGTTQSTGVFIVFVQYSVIH